MVKLVAGMPELRGCYRDIFGGLRKSSICAESLETTLG
jgi:hypothetical protein